MNAQELQARIEELVDKQYTYFALQDKQGKVLKTNCYGDVYPPKNAKNAAQARENVVKHVFKYPGLYWLNYRRVNTEPWENFTIDTRPEEQQINQPQPTENYTPMQIDDRTEKHLMLIADLKAENARLEQENRTLKSDIVRLEEEIEALEADAQETQHATMADQTVSMVGQVAQILPTVLDKWFSLQEQKNALLAEQLRRNAPQPRPQAPQNDVNNMYHEEAGY